LGKIRQFTTIRKSSGLTTARKEEEEMGRVFILALVALTAINAGVAMKDMSGGAAVFTGLVLLVILTNEVIEAIKK